MAFAPAVVAVYLALGALAGLLAGLFGVGGGLIIVPALIWVFHGQGMNPDLLVKMAVGTSLASIIATAFASIRAHQRRRAVRWELVRQLAPGIMVGAWLGAAVADQMDAVWLQRVFGGFALAVGLQMAFFTRFEVAGRVPEAAGMLLAGGVIGMISAIVGVGGGTLTVPFLVRHGVPMREAVASSAACGLPIAAAGALGFLLAGLGEPGLPPGSLGFIYGPSLLPLIVGSILFAPLGARLAHTLPVAHLRWLFALLLGVVGGKLLLL